MERSEEYLLSIKGNSPSSLFSSPVLTWDLYSLFLSAQVNRVVLNEPKDVGHFVSQEEFEQFTRAKQNDFQPEYELPVKIADKWRVLGKRFTKTYLGEAISFYLCITNDSVREDVTDVSIQVDLQLSNNRVLNLGCFRTERLEAKNSIQQIFHHEVKDLDKHLYGLGPDCVDWLIFVHFHFFAFPASSSPSTTNLSQTKFKHFAKLFNFGLKNRWTSRPSFTMQRSVSVWTRKWKNWSTDDFFQTWQNNEVYLEATLQNLSVVPICLETVALEPSEFFTVRDMNFVEDIDCAAQPALAVQNATVNATTTKRLVFGRVNRFNSTDSRQYLFCLLPKAELCGDVIMMHKINSIGKLDIMWTSAIGTKGRLQTPQLERVVGGRLHFLKINFISNQLDWFHS